MGFSLPGIISAFISWLYKPAGIILALIGASPFLLTFGIGVFHIKANPSSTADVFSKIVIAWTGWFTGEIQGFLGSVIIGSFIGIFIPKN